MSQKIAKAAKEHRVAASRLRDLGFLLFISGAWRSLRFPCRNPREIDGLAGNREIESMRSLEMPMLERMSGA
jgi:hypothetical protein